MGTTSFTVGWSETVSIGSYSNTKPTRSRTVTVGPDEDAAVLEAWHAADIKRIVQEEVDQALEQVGQPAKYSPDPRFDIIIERWSRHTHILIVPSGTRPKVAGLKLYPSETKFRLAAARAYAQQRIATIASGDESETVTLYDGSDDPDAITTGVAAIEAGKAAYEAAEAEQHRLRVERWEAQKRERESQQQGYRASLDPAGEPDPFDEGDDDSDDDEE